MWVRFLLRLQTCYIMSTSLILSIIYCIIGLFCSYYWFKEDYEEEYNNIKDETENPEKGMADIVLLIMVAFWPLVFIYKIIKAL